MMNDDPAEVCRKHLSGRREIFLPDKIQMKHRTVKSIYRICSKICSKICSLRSQIFFFVHAPDNSVFFMHLTTLFSSCTLQFCFLHAPYNSVFFMHLTTLFSSCTLQSLFSSCTLHSVFFMHRTTLFSACTVQLCFLHALIILFSLTSFAKICSLRSQISFLYMHLTVSVFAHFVRDGSMSSRIFFVLPGGESCFVFRDGVSSPAYLKEEL